MTVVKFPTRARPAPEWAADIHFASTLGAAAVMETFRRFVPNSPDHADALDDFLRGLEDLTSDLIGNVTAAEENSAEDRRAFEADQFNWSKAHDWDVD